MGPCNFLLFPRPAPVLCDKSSFVRVGQCFLLEGGMYMREKHCSMCTRESACF
jgi:hypothetical protein